MNVKKNAKKSKHFVITCIVMAIVVLLSAFTVFATVIYDSGGNSVSAGSTSGTGNTVPSGYANTSKYHCMLVMTLKKF